MDTTEKNTLESGKNPGIQTLVMLAAGIFLMAWGGHEIKGSYESASWPDTLGNITSSHVSKKTYKDSDHRTRTTFYPKVVYQYQVDGRRHTNSRINFGGETGSMKWLAQRAVDRYPAGKTVKVSYNPQDPTYSVLEAGIT